LDFWSFEKHLRWRQAPSLDVRLFKGIIHGFPDAAFGDIRFSINQPGLMIFGKKLIESEVGISNCGR